MLIIIIFVASFSCRMWIGVQTAYVSTAVSTESPESISAHKVKIWKSSSPKPAKSVHKSSLAVNPRTSTSKPQKTSSKKRKSSSSSKKPPPSRTSDTVTRSQPAQRQTRPRPTQRRYGVRKTTVRSAFDVKMIRPFSSSTIGYVYTELRSPAVTPQPACATRPDQAHSVCVWPYGCNGSNDDTECSDGQRGRQSRRRPWRRKKIYGAGGNYPVDDDRATNTVFPLPSNFPVKDPLSRAHGSVFQVPPSQLDLLYTVRKYTIGSQTTSKAKAAEQDDTTSIAFSTSYEDYDNTSEHHEILNV